MNSGFYSKNVVCLDYRNGTIIASTSKSKFNDNTKDKFLVQFHYYPKDYGIIHHIVGIWIDDEEEETIKESMYGLFENDYFDDAIDGIEDEINEHEGFIMYPRPGKPKTKLNKNRGCPHCK